MAWISTANTADGANRLIIVPRLLSLVDTAVATNIMASEWWVEDG